ncbi:hypothetical protein [Eleftheria terrae]|uniref:hypothetical protein n=1 Tax=Eleftheria terrae TaxID=1597781 RepID=UPI00263B56FD|nr:hypothetical protein [Eleftheria terrae]WKB56183.1 hypothetical protein N7L95_29525 [Eleftheria terrae]
MSRDRREYGLNEADRAFLIRRKFAQDEAQRVADALRRVISPSDQVLGAIVFLARDRRPDDIDQLVDLANRDTAALLNAATVAEERR